MPDKTAASRDRAFSSVLRSIAGGFLVVQR
jgi:hypothetical protein